MGQLCSKLTLCFTGSRKPAETSDENVKAPVQCELNPKGLGGVVVDDGKNYPMISQGHADK